MQRHQPLGQACVSGLCFRPVFQACVSGLLIELAGRGTRMDEEHPNVKLMKRFNPADPVGYALGWTAGCGQYRFQGIQAVPRIATERILHGRLQDGRSARTAAPTSARDPPHDVPSRAPGERARAPPIVLVPCTDAFSAFQIYSSSATSRSIFSITHSRPSRRCFDALSDSLASA